MKQTVQIKYRSVFQYENQKETIKYNQSGYLIHELNHKILRFFVDNTLIEIDISNQIVFTHGKSKLILRENEMVKNLYQSEYGMIPLNTKLLLYQDQGDCWKIKYQLYDGTDIISTVYLLIQMIKMEN